MKEPPTKQPIDFIVAYIYKKKNTTVHILKLYRETGKCFKWKKEVRLLRT